MRHIHRDSAPNSAGVPIGRGSRFAVSKVVGPFTARATPAALDAGTGDRDSLPQMEHMVRSVVVWRCGACVLRS